MNKMKLKKYLQDNVVFSVFAVCMTIYYGYLMFAMNPWYDELYTYYSFISRGPIYAAIHWPVPNNHVFYSVLSAFLDFFGNAYVGLRGISFLASVCNLLLLYGLAKKILDKNLAAGCVMLYAAAFQVNNLSVQGRGYTLTIFFYLISLHCLYEICAGGEKKRDYVIYALALTGGLYAIVSSTFWVLPVCVAGGLYLLYQKKYKTLLRLVTASLIAACMTFFLYTIIWLAIGSNLLCKNPDSIYYGIYQVNIILKAPLTAMKTGMEYMLATPYIQGDSRSYIIKELYSYLSGVFSLHYLSMGEALTLFLFSGTVLAMIYFAVSGRKNKGSAFFSIYLIVSGIMLPLMLIIQSVQPYYRVFAFFSVPLSLLMVCILQVLIHHNQDQELKKYFYRGCMVLMLIFCIFTLKKEDYQAQYAGRESEIAKLFQGEEVTSICYMDDFQKYVLKFYYDAEPAEAYVGEAQYVLMPKAVMQKDYEIPAWPDLYGYDNVEWEKLRENYTEIKESDNYFLYLKKLE